MNTSVTFDIYHIAPCGINCGTCIAFLREKNKCSGCLPASVNKPKTRIYCKIKNCEYHDKIHSQFCYDCEMFPCKKLEQIDKRYRKRYKTSLIHNLMTIKKIGITEYLENEINRWTCPKCGSIVSVHKENCLTCNLYLNKKAI
jgi:hypothetical protein